MQSQCERCNNFKVIRFSDPELERVYGPQGYDCRINAHYECKITEQILCPKFDGDWKLTRLEQQMWDMRI